MIDNRQWERKQERKTEKNGQPHKHQPQANQGKKRDEYVAKDNGTRPGRMDIDDITKKKFIGTCNACGKKGHKEADCRSKITCGFCGKKGHDEAHCYTKKNGKKFETIKDTVRIDAIMEVPHDHLSWTACYDDSCLVHKSSKDGSGYYPKKPQTRKPHQNVRIDTLNFRDQAPDEESDNPECQECGSMEPRHNHSCSKYEGNYECPLCESRDINHRCKGCHYCKCTFFPHACDTEAHKNGILSNEEYLDSDDECSQCGIIAGQHAPKCRRYMHEDKCPKCQMVTFNNHWQGCQFCQPEIWQPCNDNSTFVCQKCHPKGLFHGKPHLPHDYRCPKYEAPNIEYDQYRITPYGIDNTPTAFKTLLKKHLDDDVSANTDENPPRLISLEQARENIRLNKMSHENAYDHAPTNATLDTLDEDCGKQDWMLCDSMYCQEHVFSKLKDWHDQQIENNPFSGECTNEHFLDCTDTYCTKHVMIKHRFRLLTRALTKKGYNTITHEHKGQGNKTLIKEFHSMIEERIYDIKCKWCYKYQGKTWRESHLGRINIDSIGRINNKKLLVKGYINQHPVTIYVDSGADRNLITPDMVAKLQLPYTLKKRPSYVSSIVHPDHEIVVEYEIDHLPLTIAGRIENIKCDIMNLVTCDIMLGHQWLEQSNPLINWKTKEILWEEDVTQEL